MRLGNALCLNLSQCCETYVCPHPCTGAGAASHLGGAGAAAGALAGVPEEDVQVSSELRFSQFHV